METYEFLSQIDDEEKAAKFMKDWAQWARDKQLPPEGDWSTWLAMAGRGFGKTRTGAEWVRHRVRQGFRRIGIIAPTSADLRDVIVEGESGILECCCEYDTLYSDERIITGMPTYFPSKRRVAWPNGAIATLYSAEEPDRLRGPQHDTLWGDEMAAWFYLDEVLYNAEMGLRLSNDPRSLFTTTPRPRQAIREMIKDPNCIVVTGSTFDNFQNLPERQLAKLKAKYEGTRIGRQELYAELLEQAEGALWQREFFDKHRLMDLDLLPPMTRIVLAIDPAVTNNEHSAETGLIVAGRGIDNRGYVIADYSGRFSPEGWASKAREICELHEVDAVVAEVNNGGDLIRSVLQQAWPGCPLRMVRASRGKVTRAEPVSLLYESGKVSHVGVFPALEDQCCIWEPLSGQASPDRIDALVWGLSDLFLKQNSLEGGVGSPQQIAPGRTESSASNMIGVG